MENEITALKALVPSSKKEIGIFLLGALLILTIIVLYWQFNCPVSKTVVDLAAMERDPPLLKLRLWESEYFRPFTLVSVSVTALLLLCHYLIFGPKSTTSPQGETMVERFGLAERIIHHFMSVSFFVLAITGFIPILEGAQSIRKSMGGDLFFIAHLVSGCVFFLTMALVVRIRFSDLTFKKYDLVWVRTFGGYLGGDYHPPAGFFNAGLKATIWMMFLCATLQMLTGVILASFIMDRDISQIARVVHDINGLALILMCMVHLYMAIFCHHGTWRIIYTGKASTDWVKEHSTVDETG